MDFDVHVITDNLSSLMQGFLYTILICLAGVVFGIILGGLICIAKISKVKGLVWIMNAYIEVFRGTPFMIQIFLLYYVGPNFGIELSAIHAGIIGLSLYAAAYYAEIFRSGYLAVPKGQIEAAHALGMSNLAIFFRIILPQMMGLIIPPATGVTITLIKDSSVLSILTVQELTFAAQRVIGITFRYLEMYLFIALLYWALNSLLAVVSERVEMSCTRYMRLRSSRKREQASVPDEIEIPA